MEPETESLAAQLAELSRRPAGDTRVERARAQAIELAHRATTWGPFEPVAEIGWRTLRRDASIGGSVLGAALAYRIFVWLLPFVLVVVLTLALVVDQTDGNIGEAVRDAGLTGFVASSVADAAQGTRGWAVAIGLVAALFVLAYQSSALLRAVRAVTALAWGTAGDAHVEPRTLRAPLPRLARRVHRSRGLGSSDPTRARLPAGPPRQPGRVRRRPDDALARALLVPASTRRRPLARARTGALAVGAGVAAIGLFNTLVLFPWLSEREETYGVLDVAAGLLFGFFLIGRTMELAAALNATLAEERRRKVAR